MQKAIDFYVISYDMDIEIVLYSFVIRISFLNIQFKMSGIIMYYGNV